MEARQRGRPRVLVTVPWAIPELEAQADVTYGGLGSLPSAEGLVIGPTEQLGADELSALSMLAPGLLWDAMPPRSCLTCSDGACEYPNSATEPKSALQGDTIAATAGPATSRAPGRIRRTELNVAPRWPLILWDYDGTLADTIPGIVRAHHVATEALLGIRLDELEIRSRIGEPAKRRIEALVPRRSSEVFARYSQVIQELEPRQTPIFDGISEILNELTALGARQAIVTSRPRAQVEPVLRYFGISSLFNTIVGLEDTRCHKPNPGPLLRGLADLSAQPTWSVYVGDAVVDIRAAHAAGTDSIGVTWGAGTLIALLDAQPTALATTLSELRSLLVPVVPAPCSEPGPPSSRVSPASPSRNREATASSRRTGPKVNARRNEASDEGA